MSSLHRLVSVLLVAGLAYGQACKSLSIEELAFHFAVPSPATYDYVVIGAGTAGATIASRLAEQEGVSVAVIETGSFYQLANGNRSVIPGQVGFRYPVFQAPVGDYSIQTGPINGLNNKSLIYPRGAALGGSSSISFLTYQRPSRGAHDLLAQVLGDESYSWNNVLPYYKKSTSFIAPEEGVFPDGYTPVLNESAYDSPGGPLQISYGRYTEPVLTSFLDGLNDIGIPTTGDFNAGSLLGSHFSQSNIDGLAQRSSSQTAFLDCALATGRLTIHGTTNANRILFSDDKVATGVEVTTGGATYTISARKEVILSAGALLSPQLLMVSGIGPETLLTTFGIPVVSALEGVGQNLQDHPLTKVVRAVNVDTSSSWIEFSGSAYAAADAAYRANRTGPFSQMKYVLGWEKLPRDGLSQEAQTKLDAFPADWPEVEYQVQPFSLVTPLGQPEQYTTVYAHLQTTASRGSVRIVSNSTADKPLVDLNFYDDPADLELALAALKRVRGDLYGSAPVQALLAGDEFQPGPDVAGDEALIAYIRDETGSLFDAAGTTKMGQASDPLAVLDTQARVYGVQGLRVVDLGSVPLLLPGHSQSVAYMLAEKIADDIKNGA